ncbi:hypothetical protein QCA50_013710 [Cerrena zonata]|uniref:Protein kinase domain-containing protein n=1 Tax=Cerrena zonata TaxID=2478898 RepID=A0AAW0FPR5_9APHY
MSCFRLLLMSVQSILLLLTNYVGLVLNVFKSFGMRDGETSLKVDANTPHLLRQIMDSVHNGDFDAEIFKRTGDDAQRVADLLQDLLDGGKTRKLLGEVSTQYNRKQACSALVHMAESSHVHPRVFFVKVELSSLRPECYGSVSDVYIGTYKGQKVALRSIRIRPGYGHHRIREKLVSQALLWRQLHHPSIVPLFGVDPVTVYNAPVLVQPFVEKGNIREHVHRLGQKPDENQLVSWLLDIARGVEYLHDMGIHHGDLRGNNICLSDDGVAQVNDIVLTQFHEEWSEASPHANGRPGRWMAPEYLNSSIPTFEADVFSFGFVAIELYTGEIPSPEFSDDDFIDRTCSGVFPSMPHSISAAVWTLVNGCWMLEPSSRPSMKSVVESLRSV